MVVRAKGVRHGLKACVSLGSVGKEDIALVGGKGASLGEMLQAGISVPPGFVVTTDAYKTFMSDNRLDEVLEGILNGIDVHNSTDLAWAANQIQQLVLATPMPAKMAAEIAREYRQLGEGPVAVRSSATAEDLADASFAGQQRTLLNVEGAENVVRAVQACWASLFEGRAIFYRQEHGFAHAEVAIAVPVQRMVHADVAGVMFTIDPSTGDRSHMLIEAIYGLGEPLVSGELSPDAYLVDRQERRILRREFAAQPWLLCRNDRGDGYEGASERVPVPESLQNEQKLDDANILDMADLGLRLEEHYGKPQDVEWALAAGKLYIVQSRPITTLSEAAAGSVNGHHGAADAAASLTAILSGSPASPGVVAGAVRIIGSVAELDRVQAGDILVTEMTTPDFVPAMKRAAAIVTDRGGRTCHAAIVSREMGVPCVVGTTMATQTLRGIATVTVDGRGGKVYEGDVADIIRPKESGPASGAGITTRTKLYVNLADPDAAARVAAMGADGVGLLRAEFVMAHIGEHPRAMLESGRGAEFTRMLAEGLEKFGAAFSPRPVVYRFSDFKTNEYRNLRGGEAYEPHEENPMIGYRGCGRYLAEPDLFVLEIEAIKIARQRYPNLWVMVPFVRSPEDLRRVVALMEQHGLRRGPDFKLWMMAEIPANVIILDDFLDVGIDGVSIGSNDLTQLVLGVDRDNERLATQFDERNPAVMRAIEQIVRRCTERGVTCSICGQAPSAYPEITRRLVELGITSVSVSPDMIGETRHILQEAEAALA